MSILEKLYECDMFRVDEAKNKNADYMTALKKLTEIEKMINDEYHECSELLKKYQNAEIELAQLSSYNEFRRGFRIGVQLIIETLNSIGNGL